MPVSKRSAADRERAKQQARERARERAREEIDRAAALERPTLYGLLDAADVAELERRRAKRPA